MEEKKNILCRTFLLCLLIFVFVIVAVSSSLRQSPTFDEPIHLFAGYSYLKWGDFRTNPEHPPLAKALAALPLLAMDLRDPRAGAPYWDLVPEERDAAWPIVHRMLFVENDADTLFFYARLPLLALSALLGIFVYRWAGELYGVEAGLAAAFLYFLDPNLLAHSPIVHTDVPFSLFFFVGTYFYCRALRQLTWVNLLWTSVFLGLVAVTKFSFFVVPPIWAGIAIAEVSSSEPIRCALGTRREVGRRWQKAGLVATIILVALVTAYLSIWAAYGFRFNAVAGDGRHLSAAQVMTQAPPIRELVSYAVRHRLLPEAWIYGALYVWQHASRATYLLGEVSENGFWSYFPVVFLTKTPLPTLLLGATFGLWISRRKFRLEEGFLVISCGLYFSFAVWSRLNIGLRHLIPLYPFLFVLAGGAAAKLWSSEKPGRKYAVVVLALWYLWGAFNTYPHYLAYFNELVGGANNGYKVLTDSSLDWGQDLKGLKQWMDDHQVKRIRLAYFGTADPAYYGIDAVYLPGSVLFSPPPSQLSDDTAEYQAVSATYIYGVHSGQPLNGRYLPLRQKRPVAIIGHSIFVYKSD